MGVPQFFMDYTDSLENISLSLGDVAKLLVVL